MGSETLLCYQGHQAANSCLPRRRWAVCPHARWDRSPERHGIRGHDSCPCHSLLSGSLSVPLPMAAWKALVSRVSVTGHIETWGLQ